MKKDNVVDFGGPSASSAFSSQENHTPMILAEVFLFFVQICTKGLRRLKTIKNFNAILNTAIEDIVIQVFSLM